MSKKVHHLRDRGDRASYGGEKDKSREAFNRQKLLNGMMRACEKRPVSYQMLEDAVDNIEQALLNSYEREITSIHVGELAMQELKNIDEVAYVRFASVYRQFGDINTFMDELKDLLNKRAHRDVTPRQKMLKNKCSMAWICSLALSISLNRSCMVSPFA